MAQPGIAAHCRYMDDLLLWSDDRVALRLLQHRLADFLESELKLVMKPPLLQRSDVGIRFCGIHVKPFGLRPSQRRRRRYRCSVAKAEFHWQNGIIDSMQLQRHYDAAKAILLPADDIRFRQYCLKQHGTLDA